MKKPAKQRERRGRVKKSKPKYQHKSVQRLFDEYQKHKDEMSKGIGFMSLMWRSISPSVPELLKDLDNDPVMLGKIKTFLETVVGALKEDVGDVKEPEEKVEGEEGAEGV